MEDPTLVPDLPRKSTVAMFQLLVDHDSYISIHRIGISTSPNFLLYSEDFEINLE